MRCSKRDVSSAAKLLRRTSLPDEVLADLSEKDIRQLLKGTEDSESEYVMPDLRLPCPGADQARCDSQATLVRVW
ncbi:MAG: hypothetical protein LBU61_04515 [Coriobacteriales bacterium]|nr:hypothetical protein [Coriobacteriales bacterium]